MTPPLFRHPLATFVLVIALMAAGQISLAHLRNALSQNISLARQERQELQAEVTRLRLELASLTRPERLRLLAARLGMRPAASRQIVRP